MLPVLQPACGALRASSARRRERPRARFVQQITIHNPVPPTLAQQAVANAAQVEVVTWPWTLLRQGETRASAQLATRDPGKVLPTPRAVHRHVNVVDAENTKRTATAQRSCATSRPNVCLVLMDTMHPLV